MSSEDLHSVRHDHHTTKELMDETLKAMAEDCSTCYAILDELLEQLLEASTELRFHKLREHEDIRQILLDIAAVYRVRTMILEMLDPRDKDD